MSKPVRLKDVIEAIEPLSGDWKAFVDQRTGEVFGFGEEEELMAKSEDADVPEWVREQLPRIRETAVSDAYIPLPGPSDFDEYEVMRNFCDAQAPDIRQTLLDAIRGRGAFRRFRDSVAELGIEDRWYAHRDLALKQLAIEFLEDEGIPFVEA
ncbi:UPF0158 family protein [Luteimonas sp. BDR2-5]|uniref:UPF0158 family protein n=1 Tax=Proluteimonas luteida TaxID=2878685 RepID=UPI001E654110|nr:UPF0158 family protein [Luteimonas sp. BDR2-5]